MGETKDVDKLLGDPKAAIRGMFLPFFIAFAVIQINAFADTYWVSGLGTTSSEAVATIIPIYDLLVCLGIGIAIGSTTTIAFSIGKGDYQRASMLVGNSVSLGIILGIVASVVITILINPAIDLLGAGNVREEAISYMIPMILLSPLLFLNSIFGGTLRGEGAAKRSTVIQLSAALMNIVFDPILIYGLDMGVMGAGLATSLSAGVSVVIGFYWYLGGKTAVKMPKTSLRPRKSVIMELMDVGGPAALRQGITDATNLFQRVFLVIAGGTTAVMLYNYPWKYINIVYLPARSLDTAMIPVCSAAYGQDDLRKMKEGYRYTMKCAVLLSLMLASILFIFSTPLMAILTYEESMHELLPQFAWTLQVTSILIPFYAMMGVGSSMLQAMKLAKIPMYFYLIWGFVKLGLFAIAAFGLMGLPPYEGIIYSLVGLYVAGGLFMLWLANRKFNQLKKSIESRTETEA